MKIWGKTDSPGPPWLSLTSFLRSSLFEQIRKQIVQLRVNCNVILKSKGIKFLQGGNGGKAGFCFLSFVACKNYRCNGGAI